MTVIADVVSLLASEDLLVPGISLSPDWMRAAITGIAPDREAKVGDLSWVSNRVAKTDPARISGFGGSLLLVPPDQNVRNISSHAVLATTDVKLAFTMVVHQFFPIRLDTRWPAGQATVHAEARVAETAVLHAGAVIGADSIIGEDVIIGPNSCIANTTIGARSRVGAGCAIGLPGFGFSKSRKGSWVRFPHVGRVVIEEDVEIGSNTCIDRGALGDTRICRGVRIDNLVHVSHNVTVGSSALLIANAMLGGSASIGDGAWIAPSASVMNQLSIGPEAVIGMGAVVVRDVPAGQTVAGNPAKVLNERG